MAALVVHAWKDSESQRTLYINPVVAVARARGLSAAGWHVHVVDANGCIFYPEKFDHLLKFDPEPATNSDAHHRDGPFARRWSTPA